MRPEPSPDIEPAPKHLRVAPKVSRRVLQQRRRARYAVVGVAALSAASMFLLVTFHVWAAQAAFKLDKLQNEQVAEQRQNEFLRDQVATGSSATAIFTAATALGMQRPSDVALLNVPKSGGGTDGGVIPPSSSVSTPRLPQTPYTDLAAGP